jgi:hypothetical protein
MAYLLKATVVLLSISPSLQTFFKYESTAGPVIVSGDDAPNPFGTGTDKAPGARYTYGYNGIQFLIIQSESLKNNFR